MKKIFTFFLALIVGAGTMFAEVIASGYCGDDYTNVTWTLTDGGVLTVSGTGRMVDDKFYLGQDWFDRRSDIKSIVIEDGVTHIGNKSFQDCTNLVSVTIGNSVTSIGNLVFKSCERLTSITIPNSVNTIGKDAFLSCKRLKSVSLGNSVTSIGESAFSGCSALTSISIPNSVTSIGQSVFNGCSALTSATIGNGVIGIESYAFAGCSSLTSATIGNGVTSIGERAFYNCSSLTSVTIPNSVTTIGKDAFAGCSGLTSITLGSGVTSIGDRAFNGTSLTTPVYNTRVFFYMPRSYSGSYVIPDGIESIAASAFEQCESLTSVTIPNSVTTIGDKAFYLCWSLISITCKAVTPPTCGNKLVFHDIYVYVPVGSIAAYQANTGGWSVFDDSSFRPILNDSGTCGANLTWTLDEDGFLTIEGTGAMTEWSSLSAIPWHKYHEYIKSVFIKNGVTSIAVSAFEDCSFITYISIPSSITSIGADAFSGCSSLTELSLSAVPAIPAGLCTNCSSLETVNIGIATSIASDAFNGCTALHYINASSKNTAFASQLGVLYNKDFSRLTKCPPAKESYTFLSSVTSVLPAAFAGCAAPFSVTCEKETPPTVSGKTLFANVTGTIDVYVPESSLSTYQSAWGTTNCQYHALQEGECTVNGIKYKYQSDGTAKVIANTPKYSGDIVIPETITYNNHTYTVTELVLDAFAHCTEMTSITLPNSLKTIGISFNECTGLKSITIPESVSKIDGYAFMNCSNLDTIYFKPYLSVPYTYYDYLGLISKDVLIYVPSILLDEYRAKWSEMTNIQPEPIVINGLYYSIDVDKQNATVIQHPHEGGYDPLLNITIPETIDIYGMTLSVDSIAPDAFRYSEDILSISIPNSVVSIGEYAFYNCSSLTSVNIPDGITAIGDRTFFGCGQLTSIIIPASVTGIGSYAFANCTGLTSITSEAVEPPTCGSYCFRNVDKSIPLIVPEGSVAAYQEAKEWKDFSHIQEPPCVTLSGICGAEGANLTWSLTCDSVLTISGTGAMADWWGVDSPWEPYRSRIKTVVIENGVTSIGYASFTQCDTLTSITIPNTVTSIGAEVFWNCPLTTITIPSSVLTIGNHAFVGCIDLTSITCEALTPPECGTECFYAVDKSIPLIVPEGTVEAYRNAAEWSDFYHIYVQADMTAAKAVVDLIDAIGTPVTLASETAIVAARTAYDKLTDAQKELVSNYDVLVAAEEALGDLKYAADWQGWTYYDDKTYSANYGQSSGSFQWGILIPASSQTNTKLTKIALYEDEGRTLNPITLTVYNGGDLPDEANSLYSETFTPEAADQFYVVTLATPVTIDPTKNVWIILSSESSYPLSISNTTYTPNACWFYVDKWYEISALEYGAWKIRALFEESEDEPDVPAGTVPYKLVDLSTESLTEGKYLIVFDDNKAHAAVSGKDLIASSDELEFSSDGNYAFVPEEAVCAVTIAPLGTDSFSILLADGTSYMDQTAKNSVTTSENPSAFAITDGGDQYAQISKTISDGKSYVLKRNGNYFRMYNGTTYTLPKLYRKKIVKYTITWKMDDGTVIDQTKVEAGVVPTHADPVKEATAQYTYTFTGWTPALTSVTGDATYTAVFSATERSYTVTWLNWDGKQLAKQSYAYGLMPSYNGAVPVRPATEQFSYTFTGWTPAVVPVTGDATYTATFKETKNSYTITWKMEDGSVIAKETYAYGDMPSHAAPVKESTAQYTYTFTGWTPALTSVTGDATYTAVFSATERSYTVTWLNWDGSQLAKESYKYGATPSFKGSTPVRPATAQNTFTFTGWSPAIAPVSGDVTYKAQFSATGQTYTITWKMDDGSVIAKETYAYGDMPNHTAPVKEATTQYTYTFEGWTPAVVAVTSDATYTAVFKAEVRNYTVTWLNWDGSELAKESYAYGTQPAYKGATPSRPATEQFSYTFTGWTPAVAKVTGDVTYTATFKEATNTYTITWKMDDGSVIAKETYAYGDMPSHAAPVKEQTAQYTYTFSGWNPAIVPVTEDATYTAVFKATVRSYKVTFLDKDGKVIEVQEVLYNEAAVAPQAPEVEGYVFIGWDTPFDAVKSDLTVKALYEEVKDYTPSNLNALLVPKESDLQITLSWDKVEGAASYELRLVAGEKELFSQNTMGLNVISSLLSVIEKTYSIEPGTYTMSWAVRSTDAMGKAISDWAAGPQFEITIKGSGTGVENVQSDNVPCTKVLRNGMIFILRDGKTYNATGQMVK